MPVKAAKPIPELPFFFVIDDRVTFSHIFTGTSPGMFTILPNGRINGNTAKSVYSFTHFDAWAYQRSASSGCRSAACQFRTQPYQ